MGRLTGLPTCPKRCLGLLVELPDGLVLDWEHRVAVRRGIGEGLGITFLERRFEQCSLCGGGFSCRTSFRRSSRAFRWRRTDLNFSARPNSVELNVAEGAPLRVDLGHSRKSFQFECGGPWGDAATQMRTSDPMRMGPCPLQRAKKDT